MGGAMTYTWQILEMYKNADNQATEVRYHLTLTDGDFFGGNRGLLQVQHFE